MRYGRAASADAGNAPCGHRKGNRSCKTMGTFGRVEITVPRARLTASDGKSREWKSEHVPSKLKPLVVERDTRPGKYSADDGLYLLVASHTSKNWSYRHWKNGEQRWLGLGSLKDVSLKAARLARDMAMAKSEPNLAELFAAVRSRTRTTMHRDKFGESFLHPDNVSVELRDILGHAEASGSSEWLLVADTFSDIYMAPLALLLAEEKDSLAPVTNTSADHGQCLYPCWRIHLRRSSRSRECWSASP